MVSFDKNSIINSIFFPRKSGIQKDQNDHLVSVENDIEVGVRFFLKDASFDNIVFFHGNAELAQEYGDIAKIYSQYNCNFIVADYRGYGLSCGTPTKENLLTDAVKVFAYIKSHLESLSYDGKTLVMGRSLGSASAWEIVSKSENSIDGCIIESGFATEYDLLDLMGVSPESIDFSLEDGFGNLGKIKKYEKPLLIIHADLDHIIPLKQGQLAHDSALSENKKIFIVENADHNNIIYQIKEEYFKLIRSFIDSI